LLQGGFGKSRHFLAGFFIFCIFIVVSLNTLYKGIFCIYEKIFSHFKLSNSAVAGILAGK